MSIIILCAALLSAQPETRAGEPLSLERAVALGLENQAFRTVLEERVALAGSDILRHKTPENPVLAVTTEQIDQAGTETEEHYLILSQKLFPMGQRRIRAEAAERDRAGVLADNEQTRLERTVLIHGAFFAVRYHQRRLEDLEARARGAERMAEAIAERERAGLVSGLDRRKLRIERAGIEAGIATERAALAGRAQALATLLGLERLPELTGDLLPEVPDSPDGIEDHPLLRGHLARAEAATIEARAASRRLIESLTLEAGMKQTGLDGVTDRGFYLGVRLPLPAFDRNKAARAAARAEEGIARSEHRAAVDRLTGNLRAVRTELLGLLEAVERYEAEALPAARELVDITGYAYAAGEIAIHELLIAYRTLEDARLRVTDMAMAARALAIESIALGGDL